MGLSNTASKTALRLVCGYAYRADVEVPEDEPTEASERGDRVHDTVAFDTPIPAEEQGYVDAAKEYMRSIRGAQHELAYAAKRGEYPRYIGNKRKAYDDHPGMDLYGCADLIWADDNNITHVLDWKTSEQSARKAKPQLLTLAWLADAEIIHSVELRADGTWHEWINEAVEPWDLDAHARLVMAPVPADAQPVPGDHCSDHYCPLRGKCPAYTSAANDVADALIPAGSLVRRNVAAPIATAEDAAYTVVFLELAEKWLKQKKQEAEKWVLANGGELDLGTHTWKQTSRTTSGIDGDAALALAEKYGAQPHEIASCMRSGRTKPFFQKFKRSA